MWGAEGSYGLLGSRISSVPSVYSLASTDAMRINKGWHLLNHRTLSIPRGDSFIFILHLTMS